MDFLPINIRISDARILIVGGGRVATHKATILSRFTDRATVIAPEVSDGIKSLPFVCTGNLPLNHEIHQLARKRGILTIVCDSPAECDFTSPAIYRNGDLTISVASDSKDVKRSIRVRDSIKELIEHDSIQID